MGKLMKYELRGLMKFIIGVMIILLISSFVLQYNMFSLMDVQADGGYVEMQGETESIMKPLLTGLSAMVLWGSYLVSFFYIVNSFNKEITEDKGYLTFTLPVTGGQILGSKLFSAMIYFVLLVVGLVLFNAIIGIFFMARTGVDFPIGEIMSYIRESVGLKEIRMVLFLGIAGLFSTAYSLISIYFAMTVRKIIFGGKRMNGLWFIIFMIMSSLLAVLILNLSMNFPYYLDIYNMKVTTLPSVSGGMMQQLTIMGDLGGFNINIAQMFLEILSMAGLYFGTSYLLEKKIEI